MPASAASILQRPIRRKRSANHLLVESMIRRREVSPLGIGKSLLPCHTAPEHFPSRACRAASSNATASCWACLCKPLSDIAS